MYREMSKVLACLWLIVGLAHVAQSEASETVWALIGRPVTLRCNSNHRNCFIMSPMDEAAVDRTFNPDEAVLGDQCNLRIFSVKPTDLGTWFCIGGNEVEKAFELSLALQPQSVRLERVSETLEARCVVERAKPRPKFVWYIDDVLLENITATDFEDVDIHYQSVSLAPEHVNKKLRCVIDHVSLSEPQEASIVVNVDGGNGVKVSKASGIFVGFFAIIALFAFLMLMLAWAKNWKLTNSEENTTHAYNGEVEICQDIQFERLRHSRFMIRRLSERQLLQNCGYNLDEARARPGTEQTLNNVSIIQQ